MAGDTEDRARCPVCGHEIADPTKVHRCPECGSYDVAMQRPGNTQALSPGTLPFGSRESDVDPVAITAVNPFRLLLARPPKGIPRACWERVRRFRYLFVTLGFIWIGYLAGPWMLDAFAGRSLWAHTDLLWNTALFLGPVGGFAFAMLLKRAVRRLEKEIQSNNLEHCLECGYPLKGLPAEHCCPECGEPYDIEVVRRTWERYFKAQKSARGTG